MPKYNKPFLTIIEQIQLLKERGLIIDTNDQKRAEFFLRHISYYHLSIYAKAFQNKNNKFEDNITFQKILDLYNFDKKLRFLILDILERIEMSLKCVLAHEITKNRKDDYWYIDENGFSKKVDIGKILKDLKKSQEVYIQHFYKNYPDSQYPPAWIFFEKLTFGESACIARNLKDSDRQIIANFYEVSKGMINEFIALSQLRNACAHHSRIWNRRFIMRTREYSKYKDIFGDSPKNSLYAYLVVMQIFLMKISPRSKWLDKLNELIKEHDIPIYRMSFPENWKERLESII